MSERRQSLGQLYVGSLLFFITGVHGMIRIKMFAFVCLLFISFICLFVCLRYTDMKALLFYDKI